MKPVRIGVIGAGRWGRTIIETLSRRPELVLARLASTNPASARLVPATCIISLEWQRVAAADDLAGVIIATPPRLHAQMATVALQAGNGVLVEKPLALEIAEATAVVELSRGLGGIVQVDHIDLFNPAWTALKAGLPQLEGIASVEVSFGGPGPFREDVEPRWDWGSHPIALCLDLLGKPSAIRARQVLYCRTQLGLLEHVDIHLDFPDAVTARIVVSNALRDRQRSVEVRGRCATLVYDDVAAHKLVHRDPSGSRAVPVDDERALDRVLARFADSLAAGRPDWQDAELGLRVVEVLGRVDETLIATREATRVSTGKNQRARR
ncbi:MAG: hypothetical protein QOD63_2136 [Actinomycetota bacterium]|jgi:predicted dehydrogenase|nr:hypothetical protein [Actinomycetota bacterium]